MFCVLVLVTAGAGVVLNGAPAAAANATMRFNGSLNVLGVLNQINVSPSSVSVPAGGSVSFANATSVGLTLTVGGQSVALPAGGERIPSGDELASEIETPGSGGSGGESEASEPSEKSS